MNDRLDQLDLLARRAATDLEAATEVDPGLGLGRVYTAQTRHRSHTRVAAAVALVAALSAGWFVRGVVTERPVAPAVTPPATSRHIEHPWLCDTSLVTCVGRRTYLIAMLDPVRWHFPPGFGHTSSNPPTTRVAESDFTHRGHDTGVVVEEQVSPSGPDGRPAPGLAGRPAAEDLARWLAARPFLTATDPVRTTVGGVTAWLVRTRLAPDAGPGTETCNRQFRCHPVTISDTGSMTGIWADMVADYAFVDLPSGTAMVWSWAFGDDTDALARNRTLVKGISWPTH